MESHSFLSSHLDPPPCRAVSSIAAFCLKNPLHVSIHTVNHSHSCFFCDVLVMACCKPPRHPTHHLPCPVSRPPSSTTAPPSQPHLEAREITRASKQLVMLSFIVSYLIKYVGGDSTSSELFPDIGRIWRGIVHNAIEAALFGRHGTKQQHCHNHRWHCDSVGAVLVLSIVPACHFYLPFTHHLSRPHHLKSSAIQKHLTFSSLAQLSHFHPQIVVSF